jgi:hypothetical protein
MFTHLGAKVAVSRMMLHDAFGLGVLKMTLGTKVSGTGDFIGNRTPKRLSITLNYAAYKDLEQRCTAEGRSMSNLAAFILENALTKKSQGND